MPIIDIRDPVNLSDQNSADSLLGRAINGELAAAAPAREEDPKPTSSFGEGFGASLRMGMIQSITNSLSRNGINPFGVLGDTLNFKADESFNPFKYIEEQSKDGGVFGSPSRRELAYRMTELGQFDDVKSQEEFDHQYMIGEQFMRDASALSGAGMLAKSAGFATNMLGDPSNLIPLGGALAVAGKVGKAAVRSEMLAKTLAGASVAATAAIAIKKAQDAMTPVANVPGLEDEAITGLVSAAFGGIIGAATSEAISRPFLTGVEGRKLQDVRNGFARAMSNPQSRSARSPVGAAGPKDPAFAKGPAEAAEGFGEFLENAQAENRAHLQEALDGPLVQDKPVTVLTTGNDDQAKLLTALRKRYEEAGLRLHVSEHGAAADLRMSKAAEAALNISGEAIEASAAELGKTKGGAYLMKLGEWYGNIVSWLPGSSPASRMQKSTLGLLRETQRTLFGSMRTVAAGSAENPTKYNVGANAEGLKDIYHAESGRVTVGIRKDRGEAGRNGIDKDRFDSELVDNLIAKDDAARGYGDAPKASNPHVQSAADRVSAYMLKFRDRLEEVGLLEMGPQGLRAAQDELSKITAVRDAIQKRLDNDPFAARDAQTEANKTALKDAIKKYREAKLESRQRARSGEGVTNAVDRATAFYNDIQRLKADLASDAAKFPKQQRQSLERRLRRAERATAKQAAKVAEYEKAVKAQDGYFSMMYDVDRIKANPGGFIRAVADGLGIADMTVSGKRISADQMKLRPEVIEALGDDTVILAARLRELDGGDSVPMTREQALAEVPNITVGELPDTIREAYLKRLQQFYTDTAQAVHDKITHFGDIMPEAWDASSNALKARTLSIPKSIVKDYLVRDIDTLMALYHHRVGGRVAVARAIQTNERLSGLVTPDGRPVKTGDDLEAALSFALDSMSGIQARAEEMGGTAAKKSALPAIEKTKQMVQRDLISRMRLLEGAAAAPGGKGLDSEVGAFLTRSALNWNYSTMMGSAAIPNITDTGALIVQAMFGRAVRQRLAEAVRTLSGYAARDLEAVGFGLDHQSRVMALGDLPDVSTTTKGGGYGSGQTRRVSRTIDVGAQATSRFVGKASGLAWLTNTLRKTFAGVKIDMAMQDSRRILKMQALIDGGMNPDEAIRRVGFSKYEAGRLNGLGLNAKNARILHEQTYKHGVLDDGRKVSDAMSFDEYLAYKKRVHPEMMSWDNTKSVRDVLDTVTSQINQEVNRFDLLTPGVSDKPILNDKNHWKLINQFQSFAYAYVNQRVIPMSQMPATHQLAYLMTTMGLSMMADAVQNHLAGRRSIDETIKMLMTAKGAAGLVYAAWNRSGLSGWLTRPLAITDAMGVGISPGMLLENTVGSGAARHITRDRAVTSLMGPTASQIGRVVQTVADVLNLKADRWTAYNGAKLTPTNNLIWFRLLHYGTGLPVAPEWILEKSK